MGVYIYTLRAPKHVSRVKLDDGTVMTVGKLAFSYKPLWGYFSKWNPEPRWQVLCRARCARMSNIWEKHISSGGQWPQGAVTVGDDNKIEVGDKVMVWPKRWDGSVPVSVYDTDFGGAENKPAKIVEVLK